jgi:hypothetical protein
MNAWARPQIHLQMVALYLDLLALTFISLALRMYTYVIIARNFSKSVVRLLVITESLEPLALLYFGHGLKDNPEFLGRAWDLIRIRLCLFCLFFCVEVAGKFA